MTVSETSLMGRLPEMPDEDRDFTPDLARAIIAEYRELLRLVDFHAVKTIERLTTERDCWKSERDRIKAFLSEGDWITIESEQAWRGRALTAEAQRDGALEALEPFAEALEQCVDGDAKDSSDIWESSAAMSITVGNLRAADKAIRAARQKPDQ